LHEHGEFELMVRKGNYYIFAYWDKNSNLIYDKGEPAGQYGDPNTVAAPEGGVVPEINIAIPEIAQHIKAPSGFEISSDPPHNLYSRQAGAIVDMDDDLFSIDGQPESAFIQSLYKEKMPETVNFYMFYGHRGSRNPFRSNNDGTIALASLLDSRPQSEAKMNYAFNEDHASIIHSKAVLDQYNAIINGVDQKSSTNAHQFGGYLNLHFSYNDSFEGIRPQPTLVLQPIGKELSETIVNLDTNDSGRILGPFPAGDYLASFGALTAKADKKYVPVTIETNATSELNYVLRPDNIMSGYVATALKPENRKAGMPDEHISMQSITLKGAGIR
jgi:hypothetical protein